MAVASGKRGPKDKCTAEVVRKAVKLKKGGAPNKSIAAALGIHEATFYRWTNTPKTESQRELSESLKRAEADYDNALLGIIAKAAQERDWKAAAWLLERRYPELYARPDVRLKMIQEGQVPEAEQVPTFTYERSKA